MVSRTSLKKLIDDDILLNSWEDATCPICLDVPHNGVLLHCSSYDKGCRPFLCDTDQTHSNCLTRFRTAFGVSETSECWNTNGINDSTQLIASDCESLPTCPLCRGEVAGWAIVKEARAYLNMKMRCCEEQHCSYVGNFAQLQSHMQLEHPHSHPSEIDPAHQLDWENFQQSSAIIDVLSTIHAEVPHGVVLGDYVIEYGNEDNEDDYDDFRDRGTKWWYSCILYQVFGKFRGSRNRGRSSRRDARRGHHRSTSVGSIEHSPSSADTSVYRFHEVEDEFPGMPGSGSHAVVSRGFVGGHRRSYMGRRPRHTDH
ncbi:uncharacterized protein LOC110111496 [Dendrobium catenatum]|uniref:uncharacterized protein LOC110111496 n=1 Tax=Dendrobium catenatum TaxID=906689 RepID=UPI0009F37C6A|nr:uncharacterized protein LOC110111496 [Dendrobium catenatum]XP_020699071.1 uncharacterized protein LOC110111496 [Dendrobium catenatum]XP_020699080.1 uncharacterized protein LOC110111496 [Dendrobium catenatum]